MRRRGRKEGLKEAYKKAFEDSFVDNLDGWERALVDVNSSTEAICKAHNKRCRPYSYDEFCCLAKMVIDKRLDQIDWEVMEHQEAARWESATSKTAYNRETHMVVRLQFAVMETEILFMCFERAIHKVIGSRLYKLYKSEIEQFKKEEVVM